MQKFLIHESNIERLEKKLQTIRKKCNLHQFSFQYNQVGEQYITSKDEDGNEYTARYIEIEVEGTVRHNGWEFVAVLDHHEAGNIIRACRDDIEVPERYRHCGPVCEHCNRIRSRKDTYIVYNAESGEFKQVGRSCLTEYTRGLDAEEVEEIEPYPVSYDQEGLPVSIDYANFVPQLIKLCQMQQEEIDSLKSRLDALENS